MIRWTGIKQRKISQLKLSGAFKARLTKPHVLALAESTQKVGRINLPAVCVKLGKATVWEVAAGEDRIAAELVANGGKADAIIWVRVFNCDTEQELREVRAHENAHRRHDDRDKWLASLAAPPAEDRFGEDDGPIDFHEMPPESPDPRGSIADHAVADPMVPNGHMVAVNLDPPDNIAQGFDDAGPVTHASRNGYPACGAEDRPGESVVGELVPNIPITCTRCETVLAAVGGDRAKLHDLPKQPVTVESPKEKVKRRKEAAELATAVTGRKVTPAAIKQADYRERKRAGKVNPRQKHDDGGEPLGPVGTQVLGALIDVDASLKAAVTRLAGVMKAHPELGHRFPFDGYLADLKELAKKVRDHQPAAPCVFCLAEVKKDPKAACNACQGQRWITKDELATAPAELRAKVGL